MTARDPLLGEISELLHRMEACKTLDPFRWMARDCIRKLRSYESQQEDAVQRQLSHVDE